MNKKLSFKLKFLIFEIIFIIFVAAMALNQMLPNFNFTYKEFHFAHILGVIILLGNILTGAFWLLLADLKKSPQLLNFTIKTLNSADIAFTAPAAILLIWSGSHLARVNPEVLSYFWFQRSILIFTLIGLLWSLILIPLQIQFELAGNNIDEFMKIYFTKKFKAKQITYFISGGITGTLSIYILILMVFK